MQVGKPVHSEAVDPKIWQVNFDREVARIDYHRRFRRCNTEACPQNDMVSLPPPVSCQSQNVSTTIYHIRISRVMGGVSCDNATSWRTPSYPGCFGVSRRQMHGQQHFILSCRRDYTPGYRTFWVPRSRRAAATLVSHRFPAPTLPLSR